MIIKIFTNSPSLDIKALYRPNTDEFVIATDKIAYDLIENDINVDVSIGDFDSCNENVFSLIKSHSKKIIKLSNDKDNTDTKEALIFAKTLDYKEIIIYLNSSGRIDHFYSNILLLEKNVKIVDTHNEIFVLTPGKHYIKNDSHKYISFYALETLKDFEITGFKYEYSTKTFEPSNNLCTSNEGSGSISFTKGKLLVIKSNDI